MNNSGHILLVEDEEHLAVGITFNLTAEGYEVTAKGDGASALVFLKENRGQVALVILDLMLPGMSGYEVCEAMREADHLMPVLILSARALPEDRSRGFDAGADQYLTKPFELDELIARVKSLLARAEKQQNKAQTSELTEYSFADAEIDFGELQVTVDGKKSRLTRLEMKLLEYFVRNEGRVIPRGELLVNVWDMPASITTRAPDQFIRRLRKTFEKEPGKPIHFLTVRDAGYQFVADPKEGAE